MSYGDVLGQREFCGSLYGFQKAAIERTRYMRDVLRESAVDECFMRPSKQLRAGIHAPQLFMRLVSIWTRGLELNGNGLDVSGSSANYCDEAADP